MDFKVSYLDAGLPNSYFSESDQLLATTQNVGTSSTTQHTTLPTTPSNRVNRRYKTQLRDFLSTCRTKRKLSHNSNNNGQITPPTNPNSVAAVAAAAAAVVTPMATTVDYITPDGCSAAYNMYTSPYPTPAPDHSLSYMSHSNFQHSLYPTASALDNRYLTTTENLFHQYRPLSTYYPDYHHSPATSPYVGNGFLEMSSRTSAVPTYDPAGATTTNHTTYRTTVMPVDEKLYSCQQVVDTTPKYPTYVDTSRSYVVPNSTKCLDVSWPYSVSPSSGIIMEIGGHKECAKLKHDASHQQSSPQAMITPKMEEIKSDTMLQSDSPHHLSQNSVTPQHFSPVAPPITPTSTTTPTTTTEMPRQTVLMWGSNHIVHPSSITPTTTIRSPTNNEYHHQHTGTETAGCEALKSLAEISNPDICKWNGDNKGETAVQNSDPDSPHQQHQQHNTQHHNHHNSRVVMVL